MYHTKHIHVKPCIYTRYNSCTSALWQLMHLLLVHFVAPHALMQLITVHYVLTMSCHKAIVVIIGRAHCFHDCTYITPLLYLSSLCAVDHLWWLIYYIFTGKYTSIKYTSKNYWSGKFKYIAHHFIWPPRDPFDLTVNKEGWWLSTLCHSCGFVSYLCHIGRGC